MKNIILTSIFALFGFSVFLYGQNPCGQGTIIINGQDVDAVMIDGSNRQGLSLPIWLTSNSTVAAGNRVQLISIIEFNKEPQPGGGNTLVFNDVLEVGTTQQQVPNGKVWKIEGIIKYADPFTAGLSASANSPICFDDNLNLTSSVSGATYAWTGPNGFTSSAQNPTINNADFTNIGTYYLTATHNGCSYYDSVNVVVNPLPASTFSNTYAIENYASTFTPTVSGQNYSWTFASGSPNSSTVQNPQVTWTTAGGYNVDLTVTDGNNCSSTTQQNVTVSSCFANDPNSNFSWGNAIANYATAFTPDVSGAVAYNWTFDNGNPATSSQQNPSTTWNSGGTYAVTLTVSTGSACYTTTQNVTVSNCQTNQPESDFSWTMPAVANSNITFTPDDMGADTYTWTFDQATPNNSAAQSPNNIQWSSGGTYDVTLVTDFNGVGCFTTTQQVTVFSGMHTFTNCTQTGRTGPSQGLCDSEYSGTSLAGLVTVNGGIQEWVIPAGVTSITVEARGAQGGGAQGGLGAYMSGDFSVTPGETIKILVGQEGLTQSGEPNSVSGGGGSFVVRTPFNTTGSILVVAGGGGGSPATYSNNRHAVTVSAGNAGVGATQSGAGGSGGSGGNATDRGAGGGGFSANGQSSTQTASSAEGGYSFLNGGNGGNHDAPGIEGAFGGGGAAWETGFRGAGGGGGYSGGGGARVGSNSSTISGGGGGSYNSGTNQNNQAGVNSGHGQVIIYY